mmetsp:Transcript_6743/g.20410  ORF Transcript_6743/g.20410 Transcript_6743/m.20410 type:complete len:223 (-) Transcript_6743:1408-2076(-)
MGCCGPCWPVQRATRASRCSLATVTGSGRSDTLLSSMSTMCNYCTRRSRSRTLSHAPCVGYCAHVPPSPLTGGCARSHRRSRRTSSSPIVPTCSRCSPTAWQERKRSPQHVSAAHPPSCALASTRTVSRYLRKRDGRRCTPSLHCSPSAPHGCVIPAPTTCPASLGSRPRSLRGMSPPHASPCCMSSSSSFDLRLDCRPKQAGPGPCLRLRCRQPASTSLAF